MSIGVKSHGGDVVYNVKEYICDETKDIKKLPTDCGAGSTALCLETGELYTFGASKKWSLTNSNSTGGGSLSEEDKQNLINEITETIGTPSWDTLSNRPFYEVFEEKIDVISRDDERVQSSLSYESSVLSWKDFSDFKLVVDYGYFFETDIFDKVKIQVLKNDDTIYDLTLVNITSGGGGYGPSYNIAEFINEDISIKMILSGSDADYTQAYISFIDILNRENNIQVNPFEIDRVKSINIIYEDIIIKTIDNKFIPNEYALKQDLERFDKKIFWVRHAGGGQVFFSKNAYGSDLHDFLSSFNKYNGEFTSLLNVFFLYSDDNSSCQSIFTYFGTINYRKFLWSNGTSNYILVEEKYLNGASFWTISFLPNYNISLKYPEEQKSFWYNHDTDNLEEI